MPFGKKVPPPPGFDPKRRVFVGKFPVSSRFRFNVWLVWLGRKRHDQLTPEELAYWTYLYGELAEFNGKVRYIASNKRAPQPLPAITFENE